MPSLPQEHEQAKQRSNPQFYSSIFRSVFDPDDRGIEPLTPVQRGVFEERRRMRERRGDSNNEGRDSKGSRRASERYPVRVSVGVVGLAGWHCDLMLNSRTQTLYSVQEIPSSACVALSRVEGPPTGPVVNCRAANKPPSLSRQEGKREEDEGTSRKVTISGGVEQSTLFTRLRGMFALR